MEITLQSLLDEAASTDGDLAALLKQYTTDGILTADQITTLLGEARTLFGDKSTTVTSEAELGELETIADTVTALVGETDRLAEVQAQTQARIVEIAARAGLNDPEAEDGDTEGTTEGGDDAATGDSETVDVANAEVVDLTNDTADATASGSEGSATDGGSVAEPLAASSGPGSAVARRRARVNVATVARRTNQPTGTDGGTGLPLGGALVASAEAQGVRAGHMFGSWEEVGQVAANAMNAQSRSSLVASADSALKTGREFSDRNGLLTLRREFPADLIVLDDQADSRKILDRAADLSRVPGNTAESLVAAAGWCAPSETLYDLCELPCSLAGVLSFPEVSAPRGGLRWTDGIDFCDIWAAAGYFHYTEAELMADPAPTKPCMEIPCVDFNECRLEVDGMCIVGDIPQARAYPEVVAQFMQGATCARAHRTNALKIGRLIAGSQNDGAVNYAGYGATANVLSAIELKITEYLYRGLRDPNTTVLELVAPFWIRGVIRADIANRNAYDSPYDVTDAQIEAWFRARNVIPRWVYDWQSLPVICANPPAAPITAWPTQVEFMIYEAGTWVVAAQDVITLENLYDSTLIRQNKFTALFVEDAFCVMKRCNPSIRFQVPICPSGNSGAQVEVTCGAPVPLPFAPGLAPAPVALIQDELSRQVTGAPLPSGTQVIPASELNDDDRD